MKYLKYYYRYCYHILAGKEIDHAGWPGALYFAAYHVLFLLGRILSMGREMRLFS